jgi:uncharacterized tellurite resistance protein B-like protein
MDWPKFCKRVLLADGRISDHEADLIRAAVEEQGEVDKETLEFLGALKREAVSVHARFDSFFFRVLKVVVLSDGVVSDAEARWLRRVIFSDNQVMPAEAKFVAELKRDAKSWGPEFESLYADCHHHHPHVFGE